MFLSQRPEFWHHNYLDTHFLHYFSKIDANHLDKYDVLIIFLTKRTIYKGHRKVRKVQTHSKASVNVKGKFQNRLMSEWTCFDCLEWRCQASISCSHTVTATESNFGCGSTHQGWYCVRINSWDRTKTREEDRWYIGGRLIDARDWLLLPLLLLLLLLLVGDQNTPEIFLRGQHPDWVCGSILRGRNMITRGVFSPQLTERRKATEPRNDDTFQWLVVSLKLFKPVLSTRVTYFIMHLMILAIQKYRNHLSNFVSLKSSSVIFDYFYIYNL